MLPNLPSELLPNIPSEPFRTRVRTGVRTYLYIKYTGRGSPSPPRPFRAGRSRNARAYCRDFGSAFSVSLGTYPLSERAALRLSFRSGYRQHRDRASTHYGPRPTADKLA